MQPKNMPEGIRRVQNCNPRVLTSSLCEGSWRPEFSRNLREASGQTGDMSGFKVRVFTVCEAVE